MARGFCGVAIAKAEQALVCFWRVDQRRSWLPASRAPVRVGWRDTPQVRPCRLVRAIHGALRSRQPTRTGTWMHMGQSLRSNKAALRVKWPSQIPAPPRTTTNSINPNNTPDQTQHRTAKESKAEPAVDLRCTPTLYGGAGMGGIAGPSSAWMRWRSLHGRTCSVPREPTHASALPDAGTPNLIWL